VSGLHTFGESLPPVKKICELIYRFICWILEEWFVCWGGGYLSYGRHCTGIKFSDSASGAWDCGSLWFHSCAAPDVYMKWRKVWSRWMMVMLWEWRVWYAYCGLVVNRSNNKSVGQDADGISGRSLYGLMEKVFMLGTPIYQSTRFLYTRKIWVNSLECAAAYG